jgi:hypothetical protein
MGHTGGRVCTRPADSITATTRPSSLMWVALKPEVGYMLGGKLLGMFGAGNVDDRTDRWSVSRS